MQMRDRVAGMKKPKLPQVSILIVASLLIVLSLLVAMRPAIVGLIGFQQRFTEELNMEITGSRTEIFTLQGMPTRFQATGTVFGGNVKIYIAKGKTLLTIVDTATTGNRFARVCVETCELEGIDTNKVKLVFELDPGATLFLEAIHYYAAPLPNKPPRWKGETTTYTIDGLTTIDLANLFEDPDGDEIVYLATTDEGLKVIVEGSELTINPEPGVEGVKKYITVYASDLKSYTTVKFEVTVQPDFTSLSP